MIFIWTMNTTERNGAAVATLRCNRQDELGYNITNMYRVLFWISCVTVPLGAVLSIGFLLAMVFRGKKLFNVNSHALLLSCLVQVPIAVVHGPLKLYFYYQDGCLPLAGTPLCQTIVYFDYIPTQINNFLVTQLSIERFFLVVRPFVFHRARHQTYSLAVCLHYVGLLLAITFPCLYYPIIMQNGAATINLDDPSATQTCDLWYARSIYETFDLLITFVPYFLIFISSMVVTGIFLYRKRVCGCQQRRVVGIHNHRRLLFSLNLFLVWFLLTWSPWVLYDFFQTILNLTYSVYIDAITTFIVYLNYTFSSTIAVLTFKEMRQFCFEKFGLQRIIAIFQTRVGPIESIRASRIVRHIPGNHPVAVIP